MYVSKADLNKIKFRYATAIFIMSVFGHACFYFLQNSHICNVKSKVDFGVPWCPFLLHLPVCNVTCVLPTAASHMHVVSRHHMHVLSAAMLLLQPYLSVVSLHLIMTKKQFSHDFCLP